jgi:hypothetical protein
MLTCDENHIYYDDGNKIDFHSVTEILKSEGYTNFDGIPENILIAAKELGTNVHKAIDMVNKGILDYESCDPILLEYIENYSNFLNDYDVEVIESETIVNSKIWGYVGTLDLILKVNGIVGIWDIKTSKKISKTTELQTAAYKIAREESGDIKIKQRGCIQLFRDKYKPYFYNDKSNEILWKSIVMTHNNRKEYL